MALAICVFAILSFDYFIFVTQNLLSPGFPLIIRGFLYNKPQKSTFYGEYSAPLLSAFLVFVGFCKNLSPANNEGSLYF